MRDLRRAGWTGEEQDDQEVDGLEDEWNQNWEEGRWRKRMVKANVRKKGKDCWRNGSSQAAHCEYWSGPTQQDRRTGYNHRENEPREVSGKNRIGGGGHVMNNTGTCSRKQGRGDSSLSWQPGANAAPGNLGRNIAEGDSPVILRWRSRCHCPLLGCHTGIQEKMQHYLSPLHVLRSIFLPWLGIPRYVSGFQVIPFLSIPRIFLRSVFSPCSSCFLSPLSLLPRLQMTI